MMLIPQELAIWTSKFADSLHAYFWLGNRLLHEHTAADAQWRFIVDELFISCHTASESALLLIRNDRLWDAEIIIRSVSEGTIRLCNLCEGEEHERMDKAKEYWDVIPELNRIKRHDRLSAILAMVEDPSAPEWQPFRDLLMQQADIDAIRSLFPGPQRKQIEHRWSFNELLRSLAASKMTSLKYDVIGALTYGYGMSSHLTTKMLML